MTKIKTFSATVFLFAVVSAPAFAQDRGVLGSSYGWEPSSSANSEKPGIHSRMRNRETSGTSNSETIEPGDFAVTGGVSSRAWIPPAKSIRAPATAQLGTPAVSNYTRHLKQRASEIQGSVNSAIVVQCAGRFGARRHWCRRTQLTAEVELGRLPAALGKVFA